MGQLQILETSLRMKAFLPTEPTGGGDFLWHSQMSGVYQLNSIRMGSRTKNTPTRRHVRWVGGLQARCLNGIDQGCTVCEAETPFSTRKPQIT